MSEYYIVTAYRWGWTNNSHYLVHVGTDEEAAKLAAHGEAAQRGGKYGVECIRYSDGERIAYAPSSYGEKEPHVNRRLEIAETLGMSVFGAIEDGVALLPEGFREVAEVPEWLRRIYESEKRCAEIVYGAAEGEVQRGG